MHRMALSHRTLLPSLLRSSGAVVLASWARIGFRRVRANVSPRRPFTTLVIQRPYRFTRKRDVFWDVPSRSPACRSSCTRAGASCSCRCSCSCCILASSCGEEPYLEAKFGDSYRDYKRRVRRAVKRTDHKLGRKTGGIASVRILPTMLGCIRNGAHRAVRRNLEGIEGHCSSSTTAGHITE